MNGRHRRTLLALFDPISTKGNQHNHSLRPPVPPRETLTENIPEIMLIDSLS
jgi:hypothetical protein